VRIPGEWYNVAPLVRGAGQSRRVAPNDPKNLPLSTFGLLMLTTLQTAGMLVLSNLFMTFAWYGHLQGEMRHRPWYIAAVASWGIAFFEYMLQVPANRLGATQLSVAQLKIMQEAITLLVFVPFSLWYLRQPVKRDFLWAALCLMGAVYFVFRGKASAG
jgi:uncharacterized protein